ncbi:MAG: transcription termination factor Rho, transcription termination factor Rho [candidate division WS6 bacterium GW2011_GWE2_33_157]|uniref:Transcription termination factor Rho n=1 Tax=candidate division WS6 bacterium GW2011_GWB1_33_6 TaxID=1619088 RepID=A0A0G0ACA0_9BACT|nr:MAG: transcription termination factor Rho, transcription termination factor Rho [candidate division WS6 bacterium GW2011_GWE2_33_157]KKP54489.1 MAG: Transcription termination factor Rho [candidate division WS6 bacterium GW2011_GWB1_33_6]
MRPGSVGAVPIPSFFFFLTFDFLYLIEYTGLSDGLIARLLISLFIDMVNKTKSIREYEQMTLAMLRAEANKIGLEDFMELQKRELMIEILKKSTSDEGFVFVDGILEAQKDGSHGVLRTDGLLPGDNDVYVSGSQIKKFSLRNGDVVAGPARLPKDKEKYLSLLRVDTVYGKPAAEAANRPQFMKMTPIFPNRQIKLETTPDVVSTRVIDLLSPIGFGQRSMIVSPPKAGKTWLLKDIADGIAANNPQAKLIVVLVGERPEEVTDMKRFVKGEVYASNFDELPEQNCRVAEMALQKAMCMVEWGEDVIILMDSITRLARAYNITMPTSGKTLSGGFDPVALYPPKRFFGAARNFEEGGSLTIIATALVETGSRMDDLVYEEFKGTGNMELHLDRALANKRIYPSIDVTKSGTRNEELLLGKEVLNQSWRIRRMLELLDQNENPTEVLVSRLKKTKSNEEFLATLHEA